MDTEKLVPSLLASSGADAVFYFFFLEIIFSTTDFRTLQNFSMGKCTMAGQELTVCSGTRVRHPDEPSVHQDRVGKSDRQTDRQIDRQTDKFLLMTVS
jgi:hypothetical protein